MTGEPLSRHAVHPHRLAFPAFLLGNVALAFGPWMVRLSDVGAVAVGFWRLQRALPFLFNTARVARQRAHWPGRAINITILIAAIFYSFDLATWNAGIRMTKLGNATLFGNTGSFVFAIYGLWLAHRMPSPRQGAALFLALAGGALLMSQSHQLSPKNFAGDLLTLVAGLLYGGFFFFFLRARGRAPPPPPLLLPAPLRVAGVVGVRGGPGREKSAPRRGPP